MTWNRQKKFDTHMFSIWIYQNVEKEAELFGKASQKLSHANLLIIGSISSKFHLDDLKTVGGVWDQQFTNYPTNRPSAYSSWVYNFILSFN